MSTQKSEYQTILYQVEAGVLTITLNRPEQLNAFNGPMLKDLLDALDRADADDGVRHYCHWRGAGVLRGC